MTELEQLIEQKKEIEAKIKELECKEVKFGNARLSYTDKLVNEGEPIWSIDILTFTDYPKTYKPVWRKVVIQRDRDVAIDDLGNLIDDLELLYRELAKKTRRRVHYGKYERKSKIEPNYDDAVFNGETEGC